MPRSLPLGNGNMLVTLDKSGLIHDFYYPYVGMEDQTTFGHYHRVGIFDEDAKRFTWLTDEHWQHTNEYLKETLVGKTYLHSDEWELDLIFNDFVHPISNVFCRKLEVKNLSQNERNLRVFFSFDFHIYGNKGNDTAYYNAKENNLIFYKFNRYFLIDGESENGGINHYTTGIAEYRGLEGTWRDAEDGELSSHPIEQGSVDGTIGFNVPVPAQGRHVLKQWINVGQELDDVEKINAKVKSVGIDELLDYTTNYWKSWVNKQHFNYGCMNPSLIKLFKQSLLIIRTQIDNHGAIIAANDSDIMKFNKDTYSYMWTRDASFIAMSLDNTGYAEITKRYFKFLQNLQEKEGYLLHKFNPDGSPGSSWHPWIYNGKEQLPIQEDETALPIIALANHYERIHDIEFVQTMYDKFVLRAANFLCGFRDEETGLPLPSYDPWEEQKGVFTYTCSTTYGALKAAAKLSEIVGHNEHAKRFDKCAESIKEAILKNLYCPIKKTFVKKISTEGKKDYQADASIAAIFLFGVLTPDDERVVNTMRRIKEKLEVKTDIGGLARYEHDTYQVTDSYLDQVPGNPWIITTLWYAQWLLHVAKDANSDEYKEAEYWISWVSKQAESTGVLPEQIQPFTGEHLSVAPLTWSHSTFIDTILIYRQRLTDFKVCDEKMVPDVEF